MNSINVNSVKCVTSYYLLYPTQNIMVEHSIVGIAEDDNNSVVTLNSSTTPSSAFTNKCT